MAISHDPYGVGQQSALKPLPKEMLEKIEYEKRIRDRMREEAVKTDMYRRLVDSWQMAPGIDSPVLVAEAQTLGEVIRQKIADHKKMIATLEWFAAHVSLDNPEANTLVTRVVLEGLQSIEERNRQREARWETR